MFSFLTFILCVVGYLVVAGVTHGYAKHRWPPKMTKRWSSDVNGYVDSDENSAERVCATIFWPFYWTFIWPFTKANELTFDRVEKHAALRIAKNKVRIEDLHATRDALAKSNAELEEAELEVEKETARL